MYSKFGIFCEVMEEGSFTRVAERLGYTQSAISQTVKSLERELGTVLIERRKEGIALSADGRAFYPYFQDIYNGEKLWSRSERRWRAWKMRRFGSALLPASAATCCRR